MPREHDPLFVELFVKNQRRVYGYIMTVVPDCNEADDLFQQTSMVLWEKAGEFRPDGDFLCWACGITHNVVRNWRVKKRCDRHCFSDELVSRMRRFTRKSRRGSKRRWRRWGSAWTKSSRSTGNCWTCATKATARSEKSARNSAARKRPSTSVCTGSARGCSTASNSRLARSAPR